MKLESQVTRRVQFTPADIRRLMKAADPRWVEVLPPKRRSTFPAYLWFAMAGLATGGVVVLTAWLLAP